MMVDNVFSGTCEEYYTIEMSETVCYKGDESRWFYCYASYMEQYPTKMALGAYCDKESYGTWTETILDVSADPLEDKYCYEKCLQQFYTFYDYFDKAHCC